MATKTPAQQVVDIVFILLEHVEEPVLWEIQDAVAKALSVLPHADRGEALRLLRTIAAVNELPGGWHQL